eukprot:1451929-Rhodomonas_salina.2
MALSNLKLPRRRSSASAFWCRLRLTVTGLPAAGFKGSAGAARRTRKVTVSDHWLTNGNEES